MRILLLDGHVDTERREVVRSGGTERLTDKEAELLGFLAGRPGVEVRRETLLAEVWRYHPDARTRTLDTTVRRLRSKIEPEPSRPQLLQTAHGVGYRWVAPPEAPAPEPDAPAVGPRARVPTDPTRLVGREAERASLRGLLDQGPVAIVGVGGVGKSRLARAAAHDWSVRSGAPAWWVPVGGLATADDLARQVARVLQLRLPLDADRLDAVADRLSRMGPVLLVLDGADELGDDVLERLGWAGDVRLLLTRRARPPRGAVLRLRPLPPEAAAELFADQARLRQPGLAVDADGVRRLVAMLDGLPLAVQLAAARTRVLGVAELQRRLARGLDVLHDRAEPGEHGALERVLQRSWDLLAPDARAGLLRCSLFGGAFALPIAEAVLGPDAADTLESLVDAAWVEAVDTAAGLRFSLLDCVRAFVAPRWTGHDAEAARAALAAALAGGARDRIDPLFGPIDASSSGWLREHAADLETALPAASGEDRRWILLGCGFAAMAIGDERACVRCWEALGGAWGALHLGRCTLLSADDRRARLALAAEDADPRLRAAVALEQGRVDAHTGDAGALERLQGAMAAFEGLGDPLGTAEASFHVAYQHAETGDWDRAASARRRGLDAVAGRGTLVEAELRIAPYPLPAAEEPTIAELEAAAAVAREAGDRRLAARTATLLAMTALQRAEIDRALEAAREAVEAVSGASSPTLRAGVLGNAGIVLRELACFDEADDCFRTVQAELGETLHPHLRLGVLVNRAWGALDQGRLDAAEAHVAGAAALADDLVTGARIAVLRGVLQALRGGSAEEAWRVAYGCLREAGAPTHQARAALLLATATPDDADALLVEARDLGERYGEIAIVEAADWLWAHRGHPPRATAPRDRPDPGTWLGLVRLVRRLSHRVTSGVS